MKRMIFPVILAVVLIGAVLSCKQYRTAIVDFFDQPTARTVYLRKFAKDTTLINSWQKVYNEALVDTFDIPTPYTEHIRVQDSLFQAYTYDFTLKEGNKAQIQLLLKDSTQQIFYDLQNLKVSSLLEEGIFAQEKKSITLDQPGSYKLVLQPSIESKNSFHIVVSIAPQYKFPVSGKGNKAVQSFWGDPRDGGKRRHRGIDIFAKRGTPVIAAVDGFVTRTGNRGLGGKQVWLKEGLFGNSLYYAHLDSIIATQGERVKIGDTLGLIGNTGNARYTPPHLHFGIYKKGWSAINPLPFVKSYTQPVPDSSYVFSEVYKLRQTANVRSGPGTRYDKILQLSKKDTISIIAKSQQWYRIQTPEGNAGYIHQSLIRPIAKTPDLVGGN